MVMRKFSADLLAQEHACRALINIATNGISASEDQRLN